MSSAQAYPGSCHCGFVQYQIRLKFPPIHDRNAESVRLYKCNCSTCQKMGFFHCRPISPKEDFILISPTNIGELGDYRVFSKNNGWYFCKKCGVRVFGMAGVWEQAEVSVDEWASANLGVGQDTTQVLKTKPMIRTLEAEGQVETKRYHYLSVNAVTLEPSEDTDLRMWHEKGWVMYMDCRDRSGPPRLEKPYYGGMY